jgi:hypothetical protein
MKELIYKIVHSTYFVLGIGLPIAIAAIIGIVADIQERIRKSK